ncbi:hypothetical protein ILUMI_11198 [Ignelater luminosus]|uniref:Nose resistant-to-fluoxetine protein N-terminal domain-containing protein n=1 Tax=Ignelater luminosus TaxID=2038154 RepID=A0A8K0CWH7_IGNLU|nr:hypothetical protein ILUMI_11198 [Ignelater luminosus]
MVVHLWLFLLIVRLVSCEHLEESKKIIFPQITNNVEHTENKLCKIQSELYKEQLENLTLWAHEMWDATAKYTTGILRGNIFQMGDWDECITIQGPYKTQYCLASIIIDMPEPTSDRDPLSIQYSPFELVLNKIYKTEEVSVQSRHAVQMGICTPAACSPKDLEFFLNKYLRHIENPLEDENVTYSAKVFKQLCQTEDDRWNFDVWDTSFCFLVLVLVILVLLSTLLDYCLTEEVKSEKKAQKKSLTKNICISFSARKNFLDLARADESNSALSILYGMKTFCIFMIIMDHRFGTVLSGPIINFDYVEREYRSEYAAFIFHGDLFVDSFFVLSGLLVTYCLLVQFEKKIINPLFILFLRYIRLTPVYAFVIFYWASIFNHIGSGPLWKLVVSPEVQDCRENWWINLLYLNNYVNDKHMITSALADIVLAFTAALFLYLGIEAPLRKIFKELLTPSSSSHNNNNNKLPSSETEQNVTNNNTNQDSNSRL